MTPSTACLYTDWLDLCYPFFTDLRDLPNLVGEALYEI
jgi:hypothetical protein